MTPLNLTASDSFDRREREEGLAVRIATLAVVVLALGSAHDPANASTIRLACYGWQSAPVGCFDEAATDTLDLYMPNTVGAIFAGSPYHFGFISVDNDRVGCYFGDAESDPGCHYDLTAWFEPGSVGIGHVNDLGWDQAASIEGQNWLGHVPTDFTAIRIEYQQNSPCNDVRTLVMPIHWTNHINGTIVAWGRNDHGQCIVPLPDDGFDAVAAGCFHSIGLRADGSLQAWGWNDEGQCDIPVPNADFVAASGSWAFSLGLKADSSIVGWGRNNWGQCNPPPPNDGFVAVAAAGGDHSLGLKANGAIAAWGDNRCGQCDVPEPNEGFVAIAAGYDHSLGLKTDGSIVAWGCCGNGECDVPPPNTGFVAIAGGGHYSVALKDDGSIVAWGSNDWGQCSVPSPNAGFVGIAAGEDHSLGLKDDGSIATWGRNQYGQCSVPEPNAGFIAIAAGYGHSLGPRTPLAGACCQPDGTCRYGFQEYCQVPGVWQGPGTICQPNPCPPGGACCQSDGTCTVNIQADCHAPGIWQGAATVCDPNPCVRGACCIYLVCEIHTPADCATRGGIYEGNGHLCEPDPCPTSSVGGESRGPSSLSVHATPNPTTRDILIQYELPVATTVTLEIFSAGGALLRRIEEGEQPAGGHTVQWNGLDDSTHPLPSGVYMARITTSEGTRTARVVVAR